MFCVNNYNTVVTNLLLFTSNASLKSDYSIGNLINIVFGYLFFPQMKPEKKELPLTDAEKTILNLMKANDKMELGALKTAASLSGKQWDKGMKGLSKQGLVKVEIDGDSKVCVLQS